MNQTSYNQWLIGSMVLPLYLYLFIIYIYQLISWLISLEHHHIYKVATKYFVVKTIMIVIWMPYKSTNSFLNMNATLFTFSKVQRHLSKLFDNIAKMKFQQDNSEIQSKISLGMYSKEEEYVAFSEPCDCSGQVTEKTVYFCIYLSFTQIFK